VVVRAFGAPESFQIEDMPVRPVGPDEVRVAVQAAAANFVDVLVAGGKYQVKPELPFVPGGEYAGRVEEVGERVTRVQVGDKVVGGGVGGAYAEQVVVHASTVQRTPDDMDFIQAAAFRVSNTTAYHALVQRAALKAGETVLVLGAGAVGLAALQIAKALGARVIVSASSEEKRALAAEWGADAVVDANAAEWRAEVRAAAEGKPLDVVVDPIGGPTTELAFRNLGWSGRHLVIGFAAGAIPSLPVNLALVKGASLVGVDIRQFNLLEPELAAENTRALGELYSQGRLHSNVARVYPFAEFAEAMTTVASGRTFGRLVLDLTR
jgi:NADPH2:quinone reductase